MQVRDKIDKTPQFCADTSELKAGDILIFDDAPRQPGRGKNSAAFFTVQQQGFLNERGGHKAAVHAGFIVQTPDGLKLAHLTGDGFDLADLEPESENYSKFLNRTTSIYRPRKFRNELAAELAELIDELDLDKGAKLRSAAKENLTAKTAAAKIKWTAGVAVRSFLNRLVGSLKIANQNPGDKKIDQAKLLPTNVIANESICSRFVADAYISACNRMTNYDGLDYRKQLMNISSWTVPKTLQAYLYRNTNYDYFVMPHERLGLYDKLKEIILREISRLKAGIPLLDDGFGTLTPAQHKGNDLFFALCQFEGKKFHVADTMRNSIALLKELAPILKRNTGSHIVTPTSYRRVMAFAKKEGIHRENFEYELHDRGEDKIRKLARKHYLYSKPMAKLYESYGSIGYSDEEARFECEPSFGAWFKMSPVRNIVLTCSVVGFFAWVLPRGVTRTLTTEKRNLTLEQSILPKP